MRGLIPSRVIERKRRGEELAKEEFAAFLEGYLDGTVADYQMSAFLMAVHFRGLSREELEVLLSAMIHSGDVLDLSGVGGPRVDKHSTGGVGDKTSLVLAPLAAELGAVVPMVSGRGLGHTAGTLDKLDAIPGFRTQLSLAEFRRVLGEVGVAMMGQTEEIAPLDRRLYALRDATATVPSVPLIAASIMSKKLAEDLHGLVLDVKCGEGSFLRDRAESRSLARLMVELGEGRGVRSSALLTGMDAPLGKAVGNALETREALRCLRGEGPPDLAGLVTRLVGEMLFLGGLVESPEEGTGQATRALAEGRALGRMRRLVEAQGGDPRVVDDPGLVPVAPFQGTVTSGSAGYVNAISPLVLGYAVVAMGGGRRRMGDPVDLGVGFELEVAVGDEVGAGDALGTVFASSAEALARGRHALAEAVTVGPTPPQVEPRVLERVPEPSAGA